MCDLLSVHLLVVYLNSTLIKTTSRNLLPVAMHLQVCDILGVHLLVVYLHSIQVRTSSTNVLAVAMDLLGV